MKNSEDKFRVMVDTIPALVWCTLPDGSDEFHNQRWHDYTGLPEGAEHGWGWRVAYHPEDLERLLNEFQTIVASGAPGEMFFWYWCGTFDSTQAALDAMASPEGLAGAADVPNYYHDDPLFMFFEK
jgi:PAS domain-containing protein